MRLHPLQPQLLHHCFYTTKKMPKFTATVTKITLSWHTNASFSFMLLFTQYTVKRRGLPLSTVTVLLHYQPNTSAFISHIRQNAFFRNFKWTLEDLLPCYCCATKISSRAIYSKVLQPASAGKGADMSELQAHHCMTSEQWTWLLCSVSVILAK